MTYYEVTMQHNADSLLALSRMQYDLFCTRNRIVRTILSAILVIIGVLNYSAWWGILLLAYGCYLTTSTYVSPDRTAHKLTAQIKQSGKPFPCSRYCFENGGLHIFAMPENKELDSLPYSEVERVGENASYFFIFRDQFGGYMVPKDALGDKVDGFRKFIEEKTGKPVKLTQVEYSIMRMFMENPGKALSREEILDLVWGRDYFGELKIVDVNIRRLRLKIEDNATNPTFISTVWGYGYKWDA